MVLSFFCQGYMPYIYVTGSYIWFGLRRAYYAAGGFWGSTPSLAIMLLAPVWAAGFPTFAVAKFGKRRGRQTTYG